jgi:hypothetical protein
MSNKFKQVSILELIGILKHLNDFEDRRNVLTFGKV